LYYTLISFAAPCGAANFACSRLSGGSSFFENIHAPGHNFTDETLRKALAALGRHVGDPLFVTFRLHGSLPANRAFPPEAVGTSGKAFVAMDRLLDQGATGPLHLRRPEIAKSVISALRDGDSKLQRYSLHAFVVMSNHVHILVTRNVVANQWLRTVERLYQLSGQRNDGHSRQDILAGRKL
jgi:hypothetical protein